jgi:hypothetical protein
MELDGQVEGASDPVLVVYRCGEGKMLGLDHVI